MIMSVLSGDLFIYLLRSNLRGKECRPVGPLPGRRNVV